MAINAFEGGRRIERLLMWLWIIVGAFVAWSEKPMAVTTYFTVAFPGSAPSRTDRDGCGPSDAHEYESNRLTPGGTQYWATFCFTARKFPAGLLVPYRMDADGTMWGNEKYSSEVTTYTRDVVSSFAPTQEDAAWIDAQRWPMLRKYAAGAAKWIALGAFVIWVISGITGWIVRGFLGIPAGKDQRPTASK